MNTCAGEVVCNENEKQADTRSEAKPMLVVNPNAPWEVGKNYFIRTVTHHYTGRLVEVHDKELVLTDAAWIADDGRFAQAVADGKLNEVEPYPDGKPVIVGRGALVDAMVVDWPLPRKQK